MLAEGHGHELYDADAQREYQARYAGRVGTLYIHPPFEAVLYVGVAWLPLTRAYLLWSFFNLFCLATAMRQLAKQTLTTWDWRVFLGASLTFVPCLLAVLQGQDSLLLLLLVVLAFAALREGRGFACGCWLGLGLFKFEIVLPVAIVLILTQSKSVTGALAKGFTLIVLLLAGVSAALAGWSVLSVYPKFLLHLQAQPFAGIVPHAMANFRGLVSIFFDRDGTALTIASIAICSALILRKTVNCWKGARLTSQLGITGNNYGKFDLAFANTVLFAVLVSYHLNPHDLSLLLLPILVLLHQSLARPPRRAARENWITVGLIAILFLPPLHLWTLAAGIYALVSLPVLAFFLAGASKFRSGREVLVS